ncbi:MAG TPA: hypothetical protein PK493_05565, partial [Pseudomonadota bacterium]|nr:hypothetical protein [Pseudomonadota bacterium]
MSSLRAKPGLASLLAMIPLVFALHTHASAAQAEVTPADREQVVDGTLRHLQESYVYPEVAGRMATAVREKQRSGAY